MSYYIQASHGAFISGLYYTEPEAQRAVERYLQQQSRRYNPSAGRDHVLRLKESLKIVLNKDAEAPAQAVLMLRDELQKQIENDTPGTIYNRSVLLGNIRTRILGTPGQYFEVTPTMRAQAFAYLLLDNGVLTERDGIFTRTTNAPAYAKSLNGWHKFYTQKI